MNQLSTSRDGTDQKADTEIGSGVLEITERGYGFLRQKKNDYRATPGDVFVGKDHIRQRRLRTGLSIEGQVIPPTKKKGGPKLEQLLTINGQSADKYTDIIPFNEMTVVNTTHN